MFNDFRWHRQAFNNNTFNELHARTIPENISFIAFSPIFDESNMGPLTKNY